MISFTDRTIGTIVMNGIPSPGRARITGAAAVYVWEVRPGYGRSGAVVVGMGPGISKFTINFDFWEQEQLAAWEAFKIVLAPPKPFMPTLAIAVSNPILADVGITEIVVEDRGAIEPAPNGIWTVPVKVLQYRKPQLARVTPRGAIPGAGGAAIAAVTEADRALVEAQAAFARAKAGG